MSLRDVEKKAEIQVMENGWVLVLIGPYYPFKRRFIFADWTKMIEKLDGWLG